MLDSGFYINRDSLSQLAARLSPLCSLHLSPFTSSSCHQIYNPFTSQTPVSQALLPKNSCSLPAHCFELCTNSCPITLQSSLLQQRDVILRCVMIEIDEAACRPSLSRTLTHISIHSHTCISPSNSPNPHRNSHLYSLAPSDQPTHSRQSPSWTPPAFA
jgi:hypothetical protein